MDDLVCLSVGLDRPTGAAKSARPNVLLIAVDDIVLPIVKEDDLDDIPAAGRKMAQYRGDEWRLLKRLGRWREAVRAYLASISFADALVGRLVDALDHSPYRDNTVIVLWSDHGWHLGEKHHWHKFTLWEESTRVPLVIVGPSVRSGSQCSPPVSLIDVYPTLLDLCQLPANARLDGQSLAPLLQAPTAHRDRPALTTHGPGNHSVRSEHFRYIRYADGSEELYDHRQDPNEWTNLVPGNAHEAVKQSPSCGRVSRPCCTAQVMTFLVQAVWWHQARRLAKTKQDRASAACPATLFAGRGDPCGWDDSRSRHSCAISLTISASRGGLEGGAWPVTFIHTDFHSEGSKMASQSRSGQLRPKRHTINVRHAMIQYKAMHGNRRSMCSKRRSSTRQPDLMTRNSTSMRKRTV